MKEIRRIIKLYLQENQPAALATVINLEGSSYRQVGARMLIYQDGTWKGGVSGGCLERDILKQAKQVMLDQKPKIVRYDTSDDDGSNIGVGLGCYGVIDILLTPIQKQARHNPIDVLQRIQSSRETEVLVSIFKSEISSTFHIGDTFQKNGFLNILEEFQESDAKIHVEQSINLALQKKQSTLIEVYLSSGTVQILIEIIPANIQVILAGHHRDIYPMVDMFGVLGWDCCILANPLKLDKSIFKKEQVKVYPEKSADIAIDDRTAVILMAHDFATDRNNLIRFSKLNAVYIGILGPKSRTRRMIDSIDAVKFDKMDLKKQIFSPCGLDIGALSPEEIALSVASEILSFFSARPGGKLRDRKGPIHFKE